MERPQAFREKRHGLFAQAMDSAFARLAIDRSEQGRDLGRRLLADALRMAMVTGEAAAARLIVVDAIDEQAMQFNRRHGFSAELGESRLYLRVKNVRASAEGNRDTPDEG
jgi:GNAT superfamily N-acetyltransferase